MGGLIVTKPSHKVDSETTLALDSSRERWVSRGGEKLNAAFDAFDLDVGGKRCIDVGASTGGFTEVLLRRGAASVLALDVGRDQLHKSLRDDPRVISREGVNVRGLTAGPFQILVADLSFISLSVVAHDLAALVTAGGDAVVLIKPQFELQRADLGKGGVVRDEAKRRTTVFGVVEALNGNGLAAKGIVQSPIEGGDGNIEFLLWCRKGATPIELEIPT